jgi:hypothetical protein
MELIKVFGVIVGFLLLVYLLSWIFNRSKTLSNMTDATTMVTIPSTSLPNSGNMNYAYSIWIYVNDWSYLYGKEKIIFLRGTVGSAFMPSLTLDPTENTLRITVTTDDEPLDCYVPNIPLQQWVNLIVTLNNKSLDSYVNGKLVKTCVLSSLPKIDPNASVYLTPAGGFSGYTSRFQYWSSYMSPQQAWNIYKRGPGGNMFSNLINQYKIQFNFIKGSDVQASLTI